MFTCTLKIRVCSSVAYHG